MHKSSVTLEIKGVIENGIPQTMAVRCNQLPPISRHTSETFPRCRTGPSEVPRPLEIRRLLSRVSAGGILKRLGDELGVVVVIHADRCDLQREEALRERLSQRGRLQRVGRYREPL